jgi:cation transport ATPase
LSGQLCVRVEKTGDETIVGQITEILSDAAQAKSTVQLRAEQITDKTVLPTLVVGGLSLPFLGASGGLSILASDFKYRLSIVAPLSMMIK